MFNISGILDRYNQTYWHIRTFQSTINFAIQIFACIVNGEYSSVLLLSANSSTYVVGIFCVLPNFGAVPMNIITKRNKKIATCWESETDVGNQSALGAEKHWVPSFMNHVNLFIITIWWLFCYPSSPLTLTGSYLASLLCCYCMCFAGTGHNIIESFMSQLDDRSA